MPSLGKTHCCLCLMVFGTLAVGCSRKGAESSPADVPADVIHSVASAEQQFALELYARMSEDQEGENLFFSPHSIYSVLAMAAEGASGETATQMAEILGLNSDNGASQFGKTHQGLAALDYGLRGGKGDHTLLSANALWVDKSFPIAPAYPQALKPYFTAGGGVFPCDFHNRYSAEAARIDQWCADNTRGHIPNIMPELSPEDAKRLNVVLTNAVYFEGKWVQPFESHMSGKRTFHLANGEDVQVDTMFMWDFGAGRYGAVDPDGEWFATPATYNPEVPKEDQHLYPTAGGFTIAELPYKGSRLSMVLLAPRTRDTLQQVEKLLSAQRLSEWMANMESRPISRLRVPKLDLETAYDLTQQLADQGMPLPFSPPSTSGGADFSRMVPPDNSARRVYLSMVIHKATLQVDEEGSVAAAATVAMSADADAYVPDADAPFHPDFLADRPFLMLIRDRESGHILFMGRINDPR